ncbi:DUF465 domain-containing protein [Thioclava sediminum]|uniref:DUF465 domain-containing protein n=2 Tax=Thioclava TaxID=285107 RepID=A0ABX6YZM2_9RHOB|nr:MULTISPECIES: YdcH family protein [Thioclava]MPQ92840.1 DUF465 domain-containing protein [Thioclava sp. JE_KL1]OOY03829.1 DUF465 domain-containing protein [Thioclava sp. F28-4]OOY09844.1 DUF465 domain-containing protein [Thioclava sp. F36-7]OOY19253.1 DUF465 domain-containing protein [Thioclava sp. DLFJ5-1]OOY24336.1 DUF465 domain-containing protein [Thioclava sediminum]
MSLGSHITELRKKHEALSMEVERASRRPGIDDLEIAQMKRQKLRLKEEIHRLETA